jgi:pilus assembly protein CpaB
MGRRTILLLVAVVIAALGATLVFLYVQGVEAKADEAREPVEVLTADEVINAGESTEEALGKFVKTSVPRENVLEGAITSTDQIAGLVALTTIYEGEQILPAKFGAGGTQETITIPDGTMAISVQLSDPARVAGNVLPGSEVAVFLSTSSEEGAAQGDAGGDFTRLLFPKVEVIGVGSTTLLTSTTTDESGEQTTEEVPRTILTLALTQQQAEQIIFAQGHGELSMGLLNDKSVVRPGAGVDSSNLFE